MKTKMKMKAECTAEAAVTQSLGLWQVSSYPAPDVGFGILISNKTGVAMETGDYASGGWQRAALCAEGKCAFQQCGFHLCGFLACNHSFSFPHANWAALTQTGVLSIKP